MGSQTDGILSRRSFIGGVLGAKEVLTKIAAFPWHREPLIPLYDENGLCTISYTNCVFSVAPSMDKIHRGTFVDLGGNKVIAPDALGILKGGKAKEKGVADYTLRYGSPARGLGDASIWGETAKDLAGNLRKRDGKVDPGCYECWLDPLGMTLLFR